MDNQYFIILDIIGILAFSISGFIVAMQNKLDLLGGFILCTITSLGGGILRDTLSSNIPFAFTNTYPLLSVLCIFIFLLITKNTHKVRNIDSATYKITDSIGLVFFSISGALVAINSDFNFIAVVIISLITATGGGVIRDISVGNVPSLFKEDFYGMVAIIIGALMFIEHLYYQLNNTIIALNMLIGLAIRYFAISKTISMPKL